MERYSISSLGIERKWIEDPLTIRWMSTIEMVAAMAGVSGLYLTPDRPDRPDPSRTLYSFAGMFALFYLLYFYSLTFLYSHALSPRSHACLHIHLALALALLPSLPSPLSLTLSLTLALAFTSESQPSPLPLMSSLCPRPPSLALPCPYSFPVAGHALLALQEGPGPPPHYISRLHLGMSFI